MSDGIKGAVVEAVKTVGEAVVKPVADEVGRSIEVGAQSVSGKTLSPQNQLQKQQEDQKKIADVQRRLAWWKNIETQQKGAVTAKKQEDLVKTQNDNQKAKVKQFEIVEKEQSLNIAIKQAQTKTEIKGRAGG